MTRTAGRRAFISISSKGGDLLQELEEEQCARVYDEAKASGDEALPFEQAVAEIERGRRWVIAF